MKALSIPALIAAIALALVPAVSTIYGEAYPPSGEAGGARGLRAVRSRLRPVLRRPARPVLRTPAVGARVAPAVPRREQLVEAGRRHFC